MQEHTNLVDPSRRVEDGSHTGPANDLDSQLVTPKHGTIMLVDDEPTVVEILQMFLEGEGYEHFMTTNEPGRVLDLLAEQKPDVVLLDVVMPEISGLEVLRRMRADEEFRFIPVIILTSATDAETKLQALALGVNDFISKPVDPSELALRVRNTLAAKAYQDHLMNFDAVTDLPNRRLFMGQLAAGLRRSKFGSTPCAVLHIGLDHFKKINDTLGPSVGDALLKAVALRLTECVRPADLVGRSLLVDDEAYLSRLGGDEFNFFLPGMRDIENAGQVARRIISALKKSFHIYNREVFITASIGIAVYPMDGDSVDTLVKHADVAMSHAKQVERGTYQYYSEELNAASLERLNLENELRRALERGQLYLQYQPKFRVRTRQVVGAEALIRWKHPEFGIVPPDKFIPLAEAMDLISPIGEWVLNEACAQNKRWQLAGMGPIRIAVNVSARQFRNADGLKQAIRNALESNGLQGKHLTVELTEGTIMEKPQEISQILKEIKKMGVALSIDDFGTGYSSLAYLSRFRLNELKIDRCFLREIPHNRDDATIVTAILKLAESLLLTVVAEGVETEEQLAFLKERGCQEYQGFLSSKPLLPADFLAFVIKAKRVSPRS